MSYGRLSDEASAEGRGKAQAESLRKTKRMQDELVEYIALQ